MTLRLRAVHDGVGQRVQVGASSAAGRLLGLSAPVELQPWWQTVGLSVDAVVPVIRLGLAQGEDAAYEVEAIEVAAAGPTVATTSGRQLLVNGAPYRMHGYYYAPLRPGGTPWTESWAHAEHCQSDAQLMRAAGVNTLRVHYTETNYDAVAYGQCLDGTLFMWSDLWWFAFAGPRPMSVTYDRMGELYTGSAPPRVSNVALTQNGCRFTVTFQTDVPTFPRLDLSARNQVATKVGDDHRVNSENARVGWAQQGATASTSHQMGWTVQPAQEWRLDVRGFDADGRSGNTAPLFFTTPAVC